MTYYRRFSIIIGTPLWRWYISKQYQRGIEDLGKLGREPEFGKKRFTALLCGVGNEATAEEFIKFVYEKNHTATILIIDMGEEQVRAVKKSISERYMDKRISVVKTNALDLEKLIKPGTVDWIETDGFWEYFDYDGLGKLLLVWHKLLKPQGFVTTSATSTASIFDEWVDRVKIWISRVWLDVKVYSHNREKLHRIINEVGFKFVERWTVLPYFRRYTIIKRG